MAASNTRRSSPTCRPRSTCWRSILTPWTPPSRGRQEALDGVHKSPFKDVKAYVVRLKPTHKEIQAALAYDPETGEFRWRADGRSAGTMVRRKVPVGRRRVSRYLVISIGRRSWPAHRLAWFYMTERWPGPVIDHINGDGLDNRFCNLREATKAQNAHNSKHAPLNNTHGLKGASRNKNTGRWQARIKVNGFTRCLGSFDTAEEAHEAYKAASKQYFGEYSPY
ncbi:MAG: HNH endonuclease [Caulobacteraceae bacterium]|nr:HNH endonuclease [Caulobacteraceae bacterium]